MIGAVTPSLSISPSVRTPLAGTTVARPPGPDVGRSPVHADATPDSRPAEAIGTDAGKTSVGKTAKAEGKSEAQVREEQRQLQALKARDREVRAHEAAHAAAAGGLAQGGPSFTFQRGPDGQLYAIGGEVSLDVSPGRTPQETLAKAARIRAAALAPAQPSGQDFKVAAQAAQLAAEAQRELFSQRAGAYVAGETGAPGRLLNVFA